MTQIDLEFLKNPMNTSIPLPQMPAIPTSDHLKNDLTPVGNKSRPMKETKYEKEYDAFCHWSSLPKDLRKPKTLKQFEAKWGLPYNYSAYFRQRDDYQEKRTRYFYDWMMDMWPDAVYEAFKRAQRNSTSDFKVLAEIVGRNLDNAKPKVAVTPMLLIGVQPEKIDKLFQQKEAIPGEVIKEKN